MHNASFLLAALVVSSTLHMSPSGATTPVVEARSFGIAACDPVIDANSCRITWKFPSGRDVSYWVEQFDPQESWRRVEGPASTPQGASAHAVKGGFLYRVVACANSATDSCKSSTVQWAPIRPASVDAIPATVLDGHGGSFGVSKNLSYEEQRQQYNRYRLLVLLDRIKDFDAMPPMTVPVVDPLGPWASEEQMLDALGNAKPTFDQIIHFGVYQDYETQRRAQMTER